MIIYYLMGRTMDQKQIRINIIRFIIVPTSQFLIYLECTQWQNRTTNKQMALQQRI